MANETEFGLQWSQQMGAVAAQLAEHVRSTAEVDRTERTRQALADCAAYIAAAHGGDTEAQEYLYDAAARFIALYGDATLDLAIERALVDWLPGAMERARVQLRAQYYGGDPAAAPAAPAAPAAAIQISAEELTQIVAAGLPKARGVRIVRKDGQIVGTEPLEEGDSVAGPKWVLGGP